MTNRTIVIFASIVVVFVIALSLLLYPLSKESQDPLFGGAPPLYLLGIVGSVLALGAMFYFFTGRTTTFANLKQPWVDRHIIFGVLAIALTFTHAAGNFTKLPGLLLLSMAGLLVTGVFGRVVTPRIVSLRFAQNAQLFTSPVTENPSPIQAVIEEKKALLPLLSANVPEGQFSLTLSHWIRNPSITLKYKSLSLKENSLVRAQRGTTGGFFPLVQRYWRPFHQVLALLLFLGLLAHVTTVTFFADYVAHSTGREAIWFHIK
ncbi:MAG: hypothetical protein HYX84_02795 [Chloroflexi bacterium]|nr:hypothetical protein [Chloroflexota bacterium]